MDFCVDGGPFRKRTRLLFLHCGSPDAARLQCHASGGVCSFTGRPHVRISGVKNHVWISKLAEPYPPSVANFVADTLRRAVMLTAVANLSRLARSRLEIGR